MYDYLRGRVATRDAGSVVLECNGVGYRLQVSATRARPEIVVSARAA